MKRALIIATLLVSVVLLSSAAFVIYSDEDFLSYEKEVIKIKSAPHYAPAPPVENDGLAVLVGMMKEGDWQLMKDYFVNETDYYSFLEQLSYSPDDPYLQKRKKKFITSELSRLKPFSVKARNGNDVQLSNLKDGSITTLHFTTVEQDNRFKVERVDVTFQPAPQQEQQARARAGQEAQMSATNYILLPSGGNVKPEYLDSFSEYYSAVEEKTEAEGMPFKQIDFDPLRIEFRWCKKVLFVRKCGTETFVLEYGPVLSDKDVPDNESEYKVHYFQDIADVTAYVSLLNPGEYSPNGNDYVLTSVIADESKSSLTFLREGLEPWTYGLGHGEVNFVKPFAVKVIDGKLYVLDRGGHGIKPSVKVFQVYNTMIPDTEQGDFGLTYVGSIDDAVLNGFEFNSDVFDVGGFEGATASDPNTLLVADANGIHGIEIERATGMPGTTPFIKSITAAQDPSSLSMFDFVNNTIRLDGRKPNGSTDNGNVVVISPYQIASFSTTQFTRQNPNSYARYSFLKRIPRDMPVNLAYMYSEQKWYVLDRYGKIHKLSKDGKYISGGGRSGKSETNEELYFPTAITPNPIEDQTADFRYRYIIANEWGFDTGFKLFAPDMNIPEFKVFEDLGSHDLAFTFTTSGPWEHLENTNGITLQALKINGVAVPQALWSDEILPGTASTPGDNLTSVPNVASMTPTSLGMLKRGWNTATVEVKLFMDEGDDRILTRDTKFYWLPSTFTPTSFEDGNFKLNKVSDPSARFGNDTFIYKPIEIGAGGALYVDNTNLYVLDEGSVTFTSGSTFYNKSGKPGPLENIAFNDETKLTFQSGSFICVSGTAGSTFSTEKDYAQYVVLEDGYQTGVNPAGLPEYAGSQCNSPCYFMTKGAASAVFTTALNYDVNNVFQVTVDPEGTTFNERVRWEIEKVVSEGLPNDAQSEVFNNKAVISNLTDLLDYNFETCNRYNIKMSIGCPAGDFLATSSKQIATPRCESKLAAGYLHSAKIKPDGSLWTWGNNDMGQLGDGTMSSRTLPVKIGNAKWSAVTSGYFHSIGIKDDGSLWGWGYNGYGQLGIGTTEDQNAPQRIGLDNTWKAISVGATHSVAIKNDGTLWSWGGNDFGQLGVGTFDYHETPVQVGTGNTWVKVSCGYYHTVAIKSDGSLWAWGYNGVGELGDGTNLDRTSPMRIGTNNTWALIGCGADHTMAIRTDGSLWSWGYNLNGQLGNNSTNNTNSPARVMPGSQWRNVLGGELHSMGIKTDGTLWAWGNNSSGQLGDESNVDRTIPGIVRLETNWDGFTLGGIHSIVASTDKFCAVGNNIFGQLGDGTVVDKNYFTCDDESVVTPANSSAQRTTQQQLTEESIRKRPLQGEELPAIYQNFPNPAQSTTTINYYVPPRVHEAKIVVYDSRTGKKMEEFKLDQGAGVLTLDTSEYPRGLYLYELLINGSKRGVKRILVR